MGFKCGIVGLPNVGKSTLFNAITGTAAAEAANYPFCTIEPNVSKIAVPDERLDKLAEIANSEKVIPTQIEFVDIAGLVRGASKGEGLGNQFLSHIREVDAIVYVLRCFEDSNISHMEGDVSPIRDAEIIETELILADIESLEKRLPNLEKKAKQDKSLQPEIALIKEVLETLYQSKPARTMVTEHNEQHVKLLTSKPVLYVCNVSEDEISEENDFVKVVRKKANAENTVAITISAKIEEEIAQLDQEERNEFMSELGLKKSGLHSLIQAGYKLLGLITYFTAGPKEARAWTIQNGTLAPQAAGVIHTDFEKGFIRAETTNYAEYVECGGESGAATAGKMRVEGKDYIVKDGDVMHFRFNV